MRNENLKFASCKHASIRINTNNKLELLMKNFIILFLLSLSFKSIGQNIIWSDDFSAASNWSFSNTSSPPNGWIISTNLSAPIYYPVIDLLLPLNFPTGQNGYAICDPEDFGNISSNSSTNAVIQWNGTPINCSSILNVSIRFRSVTFGGSPRFLRVSGDNGNSWTEIAVQTTNIGNTASANSEEVTLNISSVAGGASQVLIAFRYESSWGWFWAIDDIELFETPPHWLQLSNPLHLLGDNQFKYTKIPSSQISSNQQMNFTANIQNQGAQNQNTTLQVSTVGYSQNSAAQNLTSLQEEAFAINTPNGFTIPSSLGTYTFNYSAQSGNPLLNPNDALGSSAIEVTDYIMAADSYDGTSESITGGFFGWASGGGEMGIGTLYEIFNPDSFQRVHVGIANVSSANQDQYVGNELYVQVWRFTNGWWEFAGFGEPYILGFGDFGNIIEINLIDAVTVNPGDVILPMAVFSDASTGVPVAFAGESLLGTTLGCTNCSSGVFFGLSSGNPDLVSTPVIRLDFQVAPVLSSNITQPSCANSCNGNISVTATGEGASITPLTYQWFANGQPIIGVNGSSLTNVCAGNYSVVVTNANGLSSTQEFTIQQPSVLSVWVDILPTTCNELSNGQFTVGVWGGTSPYSYAWSTGENTQFLEGLSAGFQAGLVITDANGCQTNAGVQTMYASTVDFGLAFVANPTAGISPLAVIFDNQTPNLSAYNFQWDFGDGFIENNNASFVPHLYSFDGIWDVTLTATDAQGCVDQLVKPGYVFSTGGVSCTHSATIQQASPLAGCIEDNIVLTCNTSPTFTYQWLLNSIPVFGANDSSFSPTLSGNYTVRITENNCPVISTPVQVTIYPTPATPQITGSGFIDACTGGNITLNATSGYSSYNWSNGAQTQDTQVSSSGAYAVTVTNAQGCSASSVPYIVNASFVDIPEVCIVGYDSITSGNLVVWENPDIEGIDSIYVYREGNVANQYFKIGAVAYEDLSVFSDVGANPAVQAYRYKLSLLDTCGTETALSELHKTIHLTINQGVGQTWNLIWSHYEGIEFGSYNIYRGTNQDDLTLLTTIASNLNSYTDLTPPAGLLYYQIEVVNEDGCDPTRSYSSSKSNIVNNNEPDVSIMEEQANWSVSLYPNPANEYVLLDFQGGVSVVSVVVVDIQGRILYSGNVEGQSASLDIKNYQSGVYFIRVSQGNKKHDLRFVKL